MFIPSATDAKAGDTVRAKWLLDGCTTPAEAAQRLEDAATQMRALATAGWTFSEPVRDDYGFLVDPQGNTGRDADEDLDESDDDLGAVSLN